MLHFDLSKAMSLDVPDKAEALLQSEIRYRNWKIDLAEQKLFYVRGLTQFRGAVVSDVSKMALSIQDMKDTLSSLGKWGMPNLAAWQAEFSPRQIYATVNKEPVSFYKAAQIILLCAVVAEKYSQGPEATTNVKGNDVFPRLKIVPAISYIDGFDEAVLAEIQTRKPGYVDYLRKRSGQPKAEVFKDMVGGKRVSHALAETVQKLIKEDFPDLSIGEVESFVPNRRIRLSTNEILDDNTGWILWGTNP